MVVGRKNLGPLGTLGRRRDRRAARPTTGPAPPAWSEGIGGAKRRWSLEAPNLGLAVVLAEATARFSPHRLYNDQVSYVGSMAVLHSEGPFDVSDE
jgi:hypothetical protein